MKMKIGDQVDTFTCYCTIIYTINDTFSKIIALSLITYIIPNIEVIYTLHPYMAPIIYKFTNSLGNNYCRRTTYKKKKNYYYYRRTPLPLNN